MISAIIQARMGASRLPNKIMASICGKPMLAHILDRVKSCKNIDSIVVATTTEPVDSEVVIYSNKNGVLNYAGSQEDVLDRYYQAAKSVGTDIIVRVTADDPFKDPEIIDRAISIFLNNRQCDYVSNTIEPTFPEGLDIEVFSFHALKKAWQQAELLSEREHVTPYIWKNPDKFKIVNYKHCQNLSHLRLTVDYPQDLEFARQIYKRLYRGQIFYLGDIIALLNKEPELLNINQGTVRNQGYLKSLQQDKVTRR